MDLFKVFIGASLLTLTIGLVIFIYNISKH